ncbi:MAG: hypothetical protein ACQEWW_09315 [Bacillota bacterium]
MKRKKFLYAAIAALIVSTMVPTGNGQTVSAAKRTGYGSTEFDLQAHRGGMGLQLNLLLHHSLKLLNSE